MHKILVTGGAGFIGSHLCRQLVSAGSKIIVVDIADFPVGPKAAYLDGVEYRQEDILDTAKMEVALRGVDIVIHLAAKHRFFGVSDSEFKRVNIDGTKSILKAMRKNDVNKIIFYSTVAVYGAQQISTTESTQPVPNSIYGKTKLIAESLIHEWVEREANNAAIIIRPTVVFGSHNKGNVYRLIRQIYHHIYYPIGNGENIKSIAYVNNIVEATIHLMTKCFNGFEIYNYSDTPDMSFKEILETIYNCLNRKKPPGHFNYELMVSLGSFADRLLRLAGIDFSFQTAIQKINNTTHHLSNKILDTGFRPMFTSKEALIKMVHWYRSQI